MSHFYAVGPVSPGSRINTVQQNLTIEVPTKTADTVYYNTTRITLQALSSVLLLLKSIRRPCFRRGTIQEDIRVRLF